MTWAIPDWWAVALLALGTYRLWRLLAEDVILDWPRNKLAPAESKRSEFLACAFCAGAWLTIAAWLFWVWQPHWALVTATPFAISALSGLVAANLDPSD